MIKYTNFNDDFGEEVDEMLYFSAYDQEWDDETIKELREKYNIIYNPHSVHPIMLITKEVPYFGGRVTHAIIGTEDDGTIAFRADYGDFRMEFDVAWIDSLIENLQEAKKYFLEEYSVKKENSN